MISSPKSTLLSRTAGAIAALTLAVGGLYATNSIAHADDAVTPIAGSGAVPNNETCNADIPGSTPGYLWPTLTKYDTLAYSAVASADGSAVYFAGSPDSAKVNQLTAVDKDTQEVIAQASLEDPYNGEIELALSPDGQSIYVVTDEVYGSSYFLVWDIQSWTMVRSIEIPDGGYADNITVMEDGKVLILGNQKGFLIDPAGEPLTLEPLTIPGLGGSYRDVRMSPNGETLAVLRNTSSDVVFYDTSTWEKLGTVTVDPSPGDQINHIEWASDSTLLATIKGSIKLIDPAIFGIKGSIDSTATTRNYNTMAQLDGPRWIASTDNGRNAPTMEVFTLSEGETSGELSGIALQMNAGDTNAGPAGRATLVVLDNLVFVGGNWTNNENIAQVAWLPRVNVVQPTTVTVPQDAESAVFSTCFTSLRYDQPDAFKLTWEGSADGGETWSTLLDPVTPSNSGFYTATVPLPYYEDYLFRVNWRSQFWMDQARFPEGAEYAGVEYESSYEPAADISGETIAGQELTATPSGFPADSTYIYQWFIGTDKDSASTPIDGATEATLTLTEDMVDQYVTVVITGSSESTSENLEATAEAVGPITAAEVQPLISAVPTDLKATPTEVEGSGIPGSLIEVSLPANTRATTDPICTTTVEADENWTCELDPAQAVGTKLNVTQTETDKLVSPAVSVVVTDQNAGGGAVVPSTPDTNNKPVTNGLAATGAAGMAGALVAALALTATGAFALTRSKRQS